MNLTSLDVQAIKKSLDVFIEKKKSVFLSMHDYVTANSEMYDDINNELIKYEKEISDLKNKIELVFSCLNKSSEPPEFSRSENIIFINAMLLTKENIDLKIKMTKSMILKNNCFNEVLKRLEGEIEKLGYAYYILRSEAKFETFTD